MRRRSLVAIAVIAALSAQAAPADAHQTSVKYVDVTVDGQDATIALTVAPGDVTEPLGLAADARPAVAEAISPAVADYVARWVALGPDGAPPCPTAAPRAHPDPDGRFVVVEWQVACDAELDRLALDFHGFFAIDSRHEAIVNVHAPGVTEDAAVVRAGEPVLHVRAGDSLGLPAWISAGVEHIWDGRDHVCFVLALLLVVMLVHCGDRWTTRTAVSTVRHTAGIVTAFTVGHSISLIAASLGYVSLPVRVVETLIAFSILYTAIENVIQPDVRWRFGLTFGFGLVHGLGFASVLRVMLPAEHVVVPLLGFNLGVELGQLVIVAIVLPLAWWFARELGAERYRRRVMPALSIVIAAIAIKWLVERALDISLVTFWGM